MKSLYAIDVGIGFTKRVYRQDEDSEVTVKSEASTLAPVPNHDESEDLTKVSFIDLDFAYYMEMKRINLTLHFFLHLKKK